MNEKKICFIWNVQDEKYFNESRKYVECLHIPDSYEVETLKVNDNNYARAYNTAMKNTDAKYKIYLYDSTFIINENFIRDMLLVFENEKIGMFGILGSKTIPTNGVWRDSMHQCGKQYLDNGKKTEYICLQDGQRNGEEIKALDGILLATQYDVSWKEELFSKKYYYDVAHGIEFKHAGYEIAVANQKSPWVLYECIQNDNKKEFEYAREKFLEEYSKDIYPLVSILIPTYNRPEYFKIALESALKQTYRNIEILVGDDSTDDRTQELIQPYLKKYQHIRYMNNGGPMGDYGYNNLQKLYLESRGEYINILMDDDVFHPEKIQIMLRFFEENNGVTLVTSYRQLIDEKGNLLPDITATQKLFNQVTVLDGKSLGKYILSNSLNVIGEPTTVLFRKKDSGDKFGMFNGSENKCLIDISQWLELLRKGNALYIPDALSFFRKHSGQNQSNPFVMLRGAIDSFQYIKDAYEYFIQDKNEYADIMNRWLTGYSEYITQVKEIEKHANFNQGEYEKFLECVSEAQTIVSKQCKFECNICGARLSHFLPWRGRVSEYVRQFDIIGSDVENCGCPQCSSTDRIRHLVMYFGCLNIWNTFIQNKRVANCKCKLNTLVK